ncbi:MAG TPA: iron-sulfur cluster assembly scaffold protein [Anaeromyxobacteraceae bacterium]
MSQGDLYHQALVRLARAAEGAGDLAGATASATLDNPLCGDRVTVEVRLAGGCVAALAHRVRGCILCQASASLLGRAAPGRTPAELAGAQAALTALLRSGALPPPGPFADLALFAPVRAVPSRHRCALLPFEALARALAEAT